MTTTPDALFYGAYRDAGLVQIEQTGLAPNQTEEARQLYNRMVDGWNADGLTISHVARTLFDVNPSQGDYVIGPNGDWPTPMVPRSIERMSVILTAQSPQPEYTLFPLTIDDWQEWRLKQQVNNWARSFYYEPPGNGGQPNTTQNPFQGIVHLLYVPTDINQVAVYLEQLHVPINATGDQELEFQYGEQEAIETNLAMRIAARHPREAQLSEDTRRLATSSLDLLKNNNNRPLKRTTDLHAGRSRTNVYTGNRYN
jgi:hypothetical protein